MACQHAVAGEVAVHSTAFIDFTSVDHIIAVILPRNLAVEKWLEHLAPVRRRSVPLRAPHVARPPHIREPARVLVLKTEMIF